MEAHSTLVFIHVLLFVFWLGTDVGVFLAAKISERSDLSVETRSTVLQLGMVLDRLPRSALVLIVPSGLQLAVNIGQLQVSGGVLSIVWAISIVWLAILWAGFLKPHTPTEQRAMLFNFGMNALIALVVLVYAVYLFMNDAAVLWLNLKILIVGLVFVAGVALDALFKPAVAAFLEIINEGATPERDDRYAKAIGPVYTAVLTIYALVLVAAYLGISKLFV